MAVDKVPIANRASAAAVDNTYESDYPEPEHTFVKKTEKSPRARYGFDSELRLFGQLVRLLEKASAETQRNAVRYLAQRYDIPAFHNAIYPTRD